MGDWELRQASELMEAMVERGHVRPEVERAVRDHLDAGDVDVALTLLTRN